MEEDIYLDKLDRRGIKPTAIRLLVIKAMMQAERAVSLLDLETLLDTVDKSTISRTIALFLSHHLIHSIDDGSGSLKYAVCDNSCNCVVQDLHSHFYCEKCHRTFCLEGTHIPVTKLSIENGSVPVEVPDFTRGAWNKIQGYRHAFAQ